MLSKLGQIAERLRGGAIELSLRRYSRVLAKVDRHESEMQRFTDDRLRSVAADLRARLSAGERADRCLPEAFALVREVAGRVLGLRPHDEQLMAGMVLHQGKVSQMETGEGKTLAAVAPAVLNGLTGRGVHVLTFNDYLARRDSEWMGPVYQFLGISVGCAVQGMPVADRRTSYASDVTYVTAKEAGFDYLRDQLARDIGAVVHRGHNFAIIDEADSILIDEARVPLVIAGEAADEPIDVRVLADIVRQLRRGAHYAVGGRARNVNLTAAGLDHLERELACGDLHDESLLPLLTRLNQALHAEHLLRRDVDYLVRDGEVLLLDELTGRVAENRRWPYGLQAAVEAKEGQAIRRDGKILNSVTIQHYVAMYRKLSGMTGTAEQAAEEFHSFYGLRVVVLPTHRPCIRDDERDQTYLTRDAKVEAVVDCVRQRRASGQPVLVGTANVEESDRLVNRLRAAGVGCQVLNAKNDHEEAGIVAEAGTYGAVTISTNMAGRGTDIKLGGHDEHDRSRVKALGGLCVIGTNRHESRRIDNQLRGRSGRQGDPGSSRFLISVEDDLLVRFGIADALRDVVFDEEAGQPLNDPRATEKVAHIQRVIEGECVEIRRTLRKYSQTLENQRLLIADRRRRLLLGDSPRYILPSAPGRYRELAQRFGDETIRRVEQQIALFEIDRCWADHLEYMAEVRESIHLFSMGGLDPYYEYQRRAGQAFTKLLQRIDDGITDRFNSAEVTAVGLDLSREQLLGPSATWTYMINDHPVGDVFDQISRSVKRLLSRAS